MLRSLTIAFGLAMTGLVSTAPASALALFAAPAESEEAPAPEASGVGIRLLDIPAATQDDPRARSYIVDRLQPGTTIERRVQVQNNTESPQTVQVYAGAAHIDAGAFVGEDAAAENELTTWISVDQPQLDMAPGTTANVLVTINVPLDAAESERYAAIWAETRSPKDQKTNIVSASRAGIRVYLSVGPGNGAPAGFEITSLTAKRDQSGNPGVVAAVTNTGGRALDISGSLSLTDGPSGLSAGPFPTDAVTTIAPDSTGEMSVTLDSGLPNGPWHAELELTSGLVAQTATGEITFPDAGENAPVRTDEDGLNVTLLAVGLGTIIVILVAVLVWIRLRRRTSGANDRTEFPAG